MRETLEATKQVPVTDAKPTPVSTDAEDQTGEHPLLPGVEGYNVAANKLPRGEITYHEFLAMMKVTRPDFRKRLLAFLETIIDGIYGTTLSHHKR